MELTITNIPTLKSVELSNDLMAIKECFNRSKNLTKEIAYRLGDIFVNEKYLDDFSNKEEFAKIFNISSAQISKFKNLYNSHSSIVKSDFSFTQICEFSPIRKEVEKEGRILTVDDVYNVGINEDMTCKEIRDLIKHNLLGKSEEAEATEEAKATEEAEATEEKEDIKSLIDYISKNIVVGVEIDKTDMMMINALLKIVSKGVR